MSGLAAAVAIARRGGHATVCESGSYPRDKVCGEMLSPEAASDLDALGLAGWQEALGAVPIRRALLTTPRGARLELPLGDAPGWSVTRRALELHLAEAARRVGVTLHERAPIRTVEAHAGGFRYRAAGHEGAASAIVGAFGKRSSLDAAFGLPRARRPDSFRAVKLYVDAPAAALEADVELHVVPGGYVGLNPVEGGRIGVCALFRGTHGNGARGHAEAAGEGSWAALLDRAARSPFLAARLEALARRLDVPPRARGLARFGFGAQGLVRVERGSLALLAGDAARMMPSFTGDGMAVALRSGRLAAAALSTRDPAAAYVRAHRAEFAKRERIAAALHAAMLRPAWLELLLPAVARAPRVAELLLEWTRGRPELRDDRIERAA